MRTPPHSRSLEFLGIVTSLFLITWAPGLQIPSVAISGEPVGFSWKSREVPASLWVTIQELFAAIRDLGPEQPKLVDRLLNVVSLLAPKLERETCRGTRGRLFSLLAVAESSMERGGISVSHRNRLLSLVHRLKNLLTC